MARTFCTLFDRRYLPRGLALYRSMQRHCGPFVLLVICLDDVTHEVLSKMALPGMRPIALRDIEQQDEGLRAARRNRSLAEYYFTCTPSVLLHILARWPDVGLLTYLDADLFFFSDPAPIYEEMAENSILIVGHRFPPALMQFEKFGIYNVGFVAFRNDPSGMAALQWWRERCLEWCYDRPEDGRFADQKYLDDWPSRFGDRVRVLAHRGGGVGPWNLASHSPRLKDDAVYVDGQPLLFFHFHGLRTLTRWLYNPRLSQYGARLTHVTRQSLYGPYVRELVDAADAIAPLLPGDSPRGEHAIRVESARTSNPVKHVFRTCRDAWEVTRLLLTRGLLLRVAGRIL